MNTPPAPEEFRSLCVGLVNKIADAIRPEVPSDVHRLACIQALSIALASVACAHSDLPLTKDVLGVLADHLYDTARAWAWDRKTEKGDRP